METNHLFQLTLETFTNVVIVDAQGTIAYMNEMYAKLLGYPKQKVIGKPVADIIPDTRLPEVIKNGHAQTGDVMNFYDHENHRQISVICNRFPLIQGGKILGAAAFTSFDNLHELDRLQEKLAQIQKENQKYKEEIKQLLQARDPLEKIIGQTPAMYELKKTIRDFAKSNLSILITGETGVGKEVFASALHELSSRRMHAFVKINCAAIPKDLLESELFGYEEGAFTGAKRHGKPGKFELADKGTILLDEIGEMPMPLQSKLLRVLQEHEVERVGSVAPKKINVRVICSTNQDISTLIKKGLFREDLYYRINTIEIKIPPLRERLEDLPALCSHLIRKINSESGGNTLGIAPDVIDLFKQYSWPGNVRELEHNLERLCFQNQNEMITLRDCSFFKEKLYGPQRKSSESLPSPDGVLGTTSLRQRRQQTEADAILNALEQCRGNKAKTARLLGIDRSSLYYKLKKYHING